MSEKSPMTDLARTKKNLAEIVDEHYDKITSFTHSTILGALGAVANDAYKLGLTEARTGPPEQVKSFVEECWDLEEQHPPMVGNRSPGRRALRKS